MRRVCLALVVCVLIGWTVLGVHAARPQSTTAPLNWAVSLPTPHVWLIVDCENGNCQNPPTKLLFDQFPLTADVCVKITQSETCVTLGRFRQWLETGL